MQPSSADVIVAGHICLDVIPQFGAGSYDFVSLCTPGGLIEVGAPLLSTGGAVANTGLALKQLGIPTRLAGKVGDDFFGQALLGILRDHDGALAHGMIVERGEVSSYTLVVSPPGVDRIFFHCPGANDTFKVEDISLDQCSGARLFHFGYPPIMRRMYLEAGKELADLFRRVRSRGMVTSLDMAQPDPNSEAGQVDWAAWLANVLPFVDVFAPSFDEILFMLDRPRFEQVARQANGASLASCADGALLDQLAERLLAMGSGMVILKLGDQGLYLRTTSDRARLSRLVEPLALDPAVWCQQHLLAPCFKVPVAGTTGAGDATIAGFIAGLLHGLSPEETAACALAVGAYSVEQTAAVSGVPHWTALQARIALGWERRPIGVSLPGWHWDAAHTLWRGPSSQSVPR